MKVKAIKTRKFMPPRDNLGDLLSSIKELKENSVLAVASKVVSIAEGRCILLNKIAKDKLIIQEADKYLPREFTPSQSVIFTVKNNMMIASAGVDESNANGYFILWPKNPELSAQKIWQSLKRKFKLKNLGVIITDSRVTPLRRGVVGVSVAFFGFKPLKDYRGKEDLFGRIFEMETSDIPDSLATAAVLEMGEGAESKPFAIISDVPYIEFIQKKYIPNNPDHAFDMPEKEDMFYPFLSAVKWKKGGSGRNQ